MRKFVPFPINVTLASPLFELAPIASNSSLGWAPNCMSPDCLSTSSWSTSVQNSTLEVKFWAYDIVFDGTVQGDMQVQVLLDDTEVDWSPSGSVLLGLHDLTFTPQHSVLLKILDASDGARLTINQVRVNGSTITDDNIPFTRWTLPSNDSEHFEYTGLTWQTNTPDLAFPTTYFSSVGDKVSVASNASVFAIYGPCGPSNGLMQVSISSEGTSTVNTSRPFQADDCLLFQSGGMTSTVMHNFVIENVDGRQLGINRVEFGRILVFTSRNNTANAKAGMIVGIVAGVIVIGVVLIIIYACRYRAKQRASKKKGLFSVLCVDVYFINSYFLAMGLSVLLGF
ncbi:P12 domain containing protein [Ceratobasidium theobromae]|uniref:P12 domain containing protein n=1 Tax=Ceratobasidium theobromae TaxID=1582974 RepID=A0A5N5QUF9_9AGAM|nr:P12 domain containing protein [Ceratobasidium theobromae]